MIAELQGQLIPLNRDAAHSQREWEGNFSLFSLFPAIPRFVLPPHLLPAVRGPKQCLLTIISLCVVAGNGCKMVDETAKLPVKAVTAVVPGKQTKQLDAAVLQTELLRYADDFFGRTISGLDEYSQRADTPKARTEALNWKLALDTSVLAIATSANATANLVDFLALSSLTRAFVEQRAAEVMPRGAFDRWLENCRSLETNAWKIAAAAFTAEQQTELRAAIGRWIEQNANSGAVFFRRPQELASSIRQAGEEEGRPGSVFSLVGLDPTSGLDPAVREVTRTRLFGERALFAFERMPFLVRWQTELLAEQLLRQEQLTNTLASADRLTRAIESASQTAASLPDRVTAERKAILDSLDKQEGKLKELSAEVSQTLTAGEKMSTSLNTTISTFDALMKRFGVGELSTTPPDTNSPPFSILDYAHTAEKIAGMAQQLDSLIKDTSGTMDAPALDKRIAQLNALSGQARADAKSVLNHAFLLAAGLLILAFACALLYRRVGAQSTATPPAHPSAGPNPA